MFTDLITNVFDTFVTVTGGLADGIKNAFKGLIYKAEYSVNPDGALEIVSSNELSPLVTFLFAIGGFALAVGIIYGIFRLIRGVASR